jgi:hypothetical protein
MYTMRQPKQPNVNSWKCHNPQRRVLGGISSSFFFAGGVEKHPTFIAK